MFVNSDQHKGLSYLLEFLYIYIELATQFRFGMREGGNLRGKRAAASGFCICPLALNLVFGGQVSNLCVLVAEH